MEGKTPWCPNIFDGDCSSSGTDEDESDPSQPNVMESDTLSTVQQPLNGLPPHTVNHDELQNASPNDDQVTVTCSGRVSHPPDRLAFHRVWCHKASVLLSLTTSQGVYNYDFTPPPLGGGKVSLSQVLREENEPKGERKRRGEGKKEGRGKKGKVEEKERGKLGKSGKEREKERGRKREGKGKSKGHAGKEIGGKGNKIGESLKGKGGKRKEGKAGQREKGQNKELKGKG